MELLPGTTRIISDGSIGPVGKPIRLYCVSLISGGSASVLSLLDGTSTGGTQYVSITGTASTGIVINFAGGMRFPDGLFADVDANVASATFIYNSEF